MAERKPTAHGRPATTRPAAYEWRLPELMEAHGLRSTVELGPLLAQRGVVLSDAQVYRIVQHVPDRLGLKTLAALCDIFGCTPNDLIHAYVEGDQTPRTPTTKTKAKPKADATETGKLPEGFAPVKADVLRRTRRHDRNS